MLKVQLPVGALLEIPANPARHRAARDWTGKSMIEFDIPLMHCRLARRPQTHYHAARWASSSYQAGEIAKARPPSRPH